MVIRFHWSSDGWKMVALRLFSILKGDYISKKKTEWENISIVKSIFKHS